MIFLLQKIYVNCLIGLTKKEQNGIFLQQFKEQTLM